MIIDCMGLPCPKPVINTRNAIESIDVNETICVLVDNEIATENLSKFCEQTNCKFSIEKKSDKEFLFYLTKGEEIKKFDVNKESDEFIAVVIDSDVMGKDEVIGKKLMEMYIYTLGESKIIPNAILFYNSGIFLTTKNDKTIEDLKKLISRGVKVYSCGACLDFFNEKLQVGEVTNMLFISDTMLKANKLIRI
ncbi:MAG: sulfurtransferase-like selenium metabolism protein YedF [Lachnospirales bacterium]